MLMSELMPQFKRFYKEQIDNSGFDYIVPIESKGMLLLEKVRDKSFSDKPQILCRRAFDFEERDTLQNKRIAVLDDTVFSGKTLDDARKLLYNRGVGSISEYTFIMYDRKECKKVPDVDDIIPCVEMKQEQYEMNLDELTYFCLEGRPSYPDHIGYEIDFEDFQPTEFFRMIFNRIGHVTEYARKVGQRNFTVHYPTITPITKKDSIDTGINKLRINIWSNGKRMRISTLYFPGLTLREGLKPKNGFWKKYYDILRRPWHDDATQQQNLYESYTISARADLTGRFLKTLRNHGVLFEYGRAWAPKLIAYYGPTVSKSITDIISTQIEESCRNWDIREEMRFNEHVLEEVNPQWACEQVMRQVKKEYEVKNSEEGDRVVWKSAGLDILELSERMECHPALASIGSDLANDYGYITPIPFYRGFDGCDSVVRRVYRLSETGTHRLNL